MKEVEIATDAAAEHSVSQSGANGGWAAHGKRENPSRAAVSALMQYARSILLHSTAVEAHDLARNPLEAVDKQMLLELRGAALLSHSPHKWCKSEEHSLKEVVRVKLSEPGPLGLSFIRRLHNGNERLEISSLKIGSQASKWRSRGLRAGLMLSELQEDDQHGCSSRDGVSMESLSYDSALKLVRECGRPVTLTFEVTQQDTTMEDDEQASKNNALTKEMQSDRKVSLRGRLKQTHVDSKGTLGVPTGQDARIQTYAIDLQNLTASDSTTKSDVGVCDGAEAVVRAEMMRAVAEQHQKKTGSNKTTDRLHRAWSHNAL